MEFDTKAFDTLEVMDFSLAGASVSWVKEDSPAHSHRGHMPHPGPVPRVETATEAMPKAISANWTRLARANLDGAAFLKILRISGRPDGWRGMGSRSLHPSALRHFLEFWLAVRHAAAIPQFALLPNGHLQALWTSSDRRRMDLEYTDTNRVYFGVLNGRRSHEGVEGSDVMAKLLLAHPGQPLTWAPRRDGKKRATN